jgi:toxin ParE1/3/4
LRYLAGAIADLEAIYLYIREEGGSAESANSFIARLRKQCRKLASLPGKMGRARPELRADIRSQAFRNYVIFFRYADGVLEIVNILEGHRDIDAQFSGDE